MADNMPEIGVKLTLSGEKEFKNAISDIDNEMKVLNSETAKLTEKYKGNEKSTQALSEKAKVLSRQIELQKEKFSVTQKALEAATKRYASAGDKVDEYKKHLASAQKELDEMKSSGTATNKEIADQEKKVAALNKKLEQSEKSYRTAGKQVGDWQKKLNLAERDLIKIERELDETEDSLSDASKNTKKFGQSLATLKKNLEESKDKIESINNKLASFGKLATSALKVFATAALAAAGATTKLTVDAAATADEILTMSTNTGLSTEFLQQYSYAAELLDVDLETLTKSMAKNVRAMDSARDGSEQYVEAYEKLGVNVKTASGELRDSEEVFWESIDALGKLTNETEKDAIAMQLFGRSAQDLNSLIAAGSEGFRELANEAESVGVALSNQDLKTLGELDDSIQRLRASTKAWSTQLGAKLAPAVNKIVKQLIGFIQKNMPDILDAAEEAAEFVGDDLLPALIKTGKWFGTNGKKIISVAAGITAGVVAFKTATIAAEVAEIGLKNAILGTTIAQKALNLAQSATPWGLVATAIAGVVTAIGIYNHTASASAQETEDYFESIENTLDGVSGRLSSFIDGIDSAGSALSNFDDTIIISSKKQQSIADGISEIQSKITAITETATAERRELTKSEIKQLENYFDELSKITEKQYDVFYGKSRVIEEMIKAEEDLTEQEVQNFISGATEIRDEMMSLAQETYANRMALLYQQYSTEEARQSEAYKREVSEATKRKDDMIAIAKEQYASTSALATTSYIKQQEEAGNWIAKLQTLSDQNIAAYESYTKRKLELDEQLQNGEIKNYEYNQLMQKSYDQLMLNLSNNADRFSSSMSEMESSNFEAWLSMVAYAESSGAELDAQTESIAKNFISTFANMDAESKETMRNTWLGIVEELKAANPEMYEAAAADANSIIYAFNDVLDIHSPSKKMREIGKYTIEGYRMGLSEGAESVKTVAQSIAEKAKSALGAISFRSVGANAGSGFVEGLESQRAAIMAKARNIVEKAAAVMRSALDIHSPSRVTRKIGQYTGEGLALGIEDMQGRVEKISRQLATAAAVTMSVPSSPSPSYNYSASFNQSFYGQYSARDGEAIYRDINRRFGQSAGGRKRYAP